MTISNNPKNGFVWLASYPKSGNTWLRLMLENLIFSNSEVDFNRDNRFAPTGTSLADLEQDLDIEPTDLTLEELDEMLPEALKLAASANRTAQFRKVHDRWCHTKSGKPRFPPEVTFASVHLVRDPRDIAISWAHYVDIKLDESIHFLGDCSAAITPNPKQAPRFLNQPLSSWSIHTKSWLTAQPRPLLIRYEEMLEAPIDVLRRVATHCGISYTEAKLTESAASTSFETLKRLEQIEGFNIGQAPGKPFFRNGTSGDWQSTLSESQLARIESDHGEMMQYLGYTLAL